MMIDRSLRQFLQIALLSLATACSGGGESGPLVPPIETVPPPQQAQPTAISLKSDAGDYVGSGEDYSYGNDDSVIKITTDGAHILISIIGDESWIGEFQLPNTYTNVQPGSYPNLERYPFHDPAFGGINWSRDGRFCSTLNGWLVIENVTFDGSTLSGIDLQFEQTCNGNAAVLQGDIHWDANDATNPPGPVVTPPVGLWEPGPGVTPVTGNYVYLESQPGDKIGQGVNYVYSEVTALVTANAADGRLSVSVTEHERWNGDFQAMDHLKQLEIGYYGDLRRYPFHNPVKGGISWTGERRGCTTLTGWFVVDSVTYDGPTLTGIDLRFEQHCEGVIAALNGEIHWAAGDSMNAPGPLVPLPAGLWEPAVGATPATGNYIYLESEPWDYIGAGGTYTYTLADSRITVGTTEALLTVVIDGDERWSSDFRAMDVLSRLEVGYYGVLQHYPYHDTFKGGLRWFGEGRGCNNLIGWFVVDNVTYDGTALMAIDLRFEQHCDGSPYALRGKIHWDVNDPTSPPGPVVPPPAGLWEPAVGVTPAIGNYVYLESQPGDFIGLGGIYSYTQADSLLMVSSTEATLNVTISGDERWSGAFQAMSHLTRLEVGYYPDLQRWPFHNPVKGGVDWGGEGRGCNKLAGWFVVDSVTYDGTDLTAIKLRFEQHCEGGGPALNGEIYWDANDPTSPPGPVIPPPAGLWEPPVGVVPATGSYLYLESQPGDFVGQGENYLLTPADSEFLLSTNGAYLQLYVDVNSLDVSDSWLGNFLGMKQQARLEVGYYPDLQRWPFHNPVKGGFSWVGQGRGCNSLTGWFAIDSVTYVGTVVTAIKFRFEQHCEGRAPALFGEARWSQ